ncbi:hypothetical protein RRG08_013888 [Elysia crispata]|uniref:Uncharacterized protein n=1 Tax=Elysia crispata TaxID=231223 RepID=A0AAE1D0I2_9GAST|nr:hypothetical protein RRG08_013888 [Elysia crispata]
MFTNKQDTSGQRHREVYLSALAGPGLPGLALTVSAGRPICPARLNSPGSPHYLRQGLLPHPSPEVLSAHWTRRSMVVASIMRSVLSYSRIVSYLGESPATFTHSTLRYSTRRRRRRLCLLREATEEKGKLAKVGVS